MTRTGGWLAASGCRLAARPEVREPARRPARSDRPPRDNVVMRFALAFLIAACLAVPAAQLHEHEGAPPERLGTVHFATSCRADVQPAFDRAVALLHSFSFTYAREAFSGVLEKDATCAMAH